MIEETLITVDPTLVDPNRYQMRIDLGDLSDLESIREKGFIQTPKARKVLDSRYELQFGHRRHAAWMLYRPGELMPLIVAELDDREMAERAALENLQKPLSAIEKGNGIKRYMSEFGMTQAEAGALFGYQTQGAAGNALGLLKLPQSMQDLIQRGDLPERHARALRSLASIDVKAAEKAAQAIAKAEPDDRDATLYKELDHYIDKHGESLRWTPWRDLDWPVSPIATGNQHVPKVPACSGCRFNVRTDARDKEERGCIRRQCYKLKIVAWANAKAEQCAKQFGIAVAQPNETPLTIIFDGGYKDVDFARAALKTKHESLRAIAVTTDTRGSAYTRESVTGSEYVILASTDITALKKAVKAVPEPEAKRELSKYELDRKKQNAERNARARVVRVLIGNTAPAFAPLVPPVLHDLLFNRLAYDIGRSMGEAQMKWKAASERERSELIMTAALKSYVELSSYSAPAIDKASQRIASLAKAAGVKLPPGWDAAPEPPTKIKKPAARKPAKKGKGR